MASELLVAWIAAPTLLLGLFASIGLGVRAIARGSLPMSVAPICGLAVAMSAGSVLANHASELIVPFLVISAVAGTLAGWRHLPAIDPWGVAVAVGAFGLFAVPIVLSGEATLAGFIKLDDTATWLGLTDRIMESGTSAGGLEPSTYQRMLDINLGNGYPVGGFVPLGFASRVLATDPAWLFQPYLAVIGSLLALCLWQLTREALPSRPLRAMCAVGASQSALLVGFYLWGGVKELLVAALVAAAVICAVDALKADNAREWLPLAFVCLGIVAAGSLGGLIWAAPAIAVALSALWSRRLSKTARRRALLVLPALGLFVATVVVVGSGPSPLKRSFTDQGDLGNLAGPIDPAQIVGIWPASDFRFDPGSGLVAELLVALTIAAAVLGIAYALGRRDLSVLAYSVGTVCVAGATVLIASPWLDSKALAIASPAVLLAALVGAGRLSMWKLAPGGVALSLIFLGVGWSLGTQWGGASLAPRDHLEELAEIAEEIKGEGPTLMTEYSPYGARHFLRDADPESISELRVREVSLRIGRVVDKGGSADTDEVDPGALGIYHTLVLRRSPTRSRPPAAYRRVWAGRVYEAWQRAEEADVPSDRLALGSEHHPAAKPRCNEVRGLAAGGRDLVAAPEMSPVVVPLGEVEYPRAWRRAGSGSMPAPDTAGSIRAEVRLQEAGTYEVWLGGSIRSRAELIVDGRPSGSVRHILTNSGGYAALGSAPLEPGVHRIEVRIGGADLGPGSGGVHPPIGPLAVTAAESAQPRLVRVSAGDAAARLCGRAWDWIEPAG